MHVSFADWYSPASVRPDLAELEARSAAVGAVATRLAGEPQDAVALVEAVFDRGRPLGQLEWFVTSLKDADPTLRLEDAENMLHVLAGCALATIMTRTDVDWSEVANAVRCASLAGARTPRVAGYLSRIADACLARWQVQNRSASVPDVPSALASLKGVVDAAHAKMAGSPDVPTVIDGIRTMGTQMAEGLRAHSALQAAHAKGLGRQVLQQREELDMLWWVLGGWVDELGGPLSAVAPKAAPVVVGWCLGGLVRIEPQPRALPAIVARALAQVRGVDAQPVSVAEAVEALPEVLLEAYGREAAKFVPRFVNVTPVCAALARAAEEPDRWRPSFERMTGIRSEATLTPRDLAEQIVAERTLVRQFGE